VNNINPKVLLVDDNIDAVDMLSELLTGYGIENRVTYSGEDGLAMFMAWDANLVLLDIRMPGMDGFETAKAMRAVPGRQHVPIVALSGWGGHDVERALPFGGFSHWLTKPAQVHELLEVIQRAVVRARGEQR